MGGYARGNTSKGIPRNYCAESLRNILKQAKLIGQANCVQGNFSELATTDQPTVIYCDPPYLGTTGYSTASFPHTQFWSKARHWVESGADVFVSEYSAPKGWEPIWEKPLRSNIRRGSEARHIATEKLFVWKGNK